MPAPRDFSIGKTAEGKRLRTFTDDSGRVVIVCGEEAVSLSPNAAAAFAEAVSDNARAILEKH